MRTEKTIGFQLNRKELEAAIRQYCQIPEGTKQETFWVSSEAKAENHMVVGVIYVVEEINGMQATA